MTTIQHRWHASSHVFCFCESNPCFLKKLTLRVMPRRRLCETARPIFFFRHSSWRLTFEAKKALNCFVTDILKTARWKFFIQHFKGENRKIVFLGQTVSDPVGPERWRQPWPLPGKFPVGKICDLRCTIKAHLTWMHFAYLQNLFESLIEWILFFPRAILLVSYYILRTFREENRKKGIFN